MYDLRQFGLKQMIESGRTLRGLGKHASNMEEAAGEVASFLHHSFRDGGSQTRNCVLVRCFKTHPFGTLPRDLQTTVLDRMESVPPSEAMRCLCLLASCGEHPAWNGRHGSRDHRAIPLSTSETVTNTPMLAQLVKQLGLQISDLVAPDGMVDDSGLRTFDVFHVEEARGSRFVPDQAGFVEPWGVRSVLGFGGILPSQELFAIVMFSRVPVGVETAKLFRTLALGVKLVLLPFVGKEIFGAN